jgi:hypothetical protein
MVPMKAALMQPYFFPYLGYFQLIKAVDQFIVYDDVQYMKGGWINRNRILMENKPAWISLPVPPDSVSSEIRERRLSEREYEKSRIKILGQLHAAYRKAPHYAETRQLVESILAYDEPCLSLFLFNSLQKTSQHLGIETPLVLSSALQKNDSALSGRDRVIAICKSVSATTYINSMGGRELYNVEEFAAEKIKLQFIEMSPIYYQQGGENFVPYLSIIDVMMFNDKTAIGQHLQQYTLGA